MHLVLQVKEINPTQAQGTNCLPAAQDSEIFMEIIKFPAGGK
jgi:hypothetical protein